MIRIVALSLGQTAAVVYHGRATTTAGDKRPVAAAWLGPEGFTGDAQADRENHGGPDKAVCAYPSEHYAFWAAQLGRPAPPSAFSENFTLEGLTEAEAYLGDSYAVGGAVVQVCQPRMPCFKLAGRLNYPEAPDLIHVTGKSGFYLRVLTPGEVHTGDELILRERHPASVSIQFVNEVLYRHRVNCESFEAILAVDAAAAVLRKIIGRQMERQKAE